MPTLTAPATARAAAFERGLVLSDEHETSAQNGAEVPTEKQVPAAQRREQQRLAREHLYPLLSDVFPKSSACHRRRWRSASTSRFWKSLAMISIRPSCRPSCGIGAGDGLTC